MNSRDADRAAKVKAVNRVHKAAMEWHPKLTEIWKPLVGEKITKVDGYNFLAKYAKLMPELPNSMGADGIQLYRLTSEYSLGWCVKACEQCLGTEHCLYYEITIYIGEMSGGRLTELTKNPPDYRADYTEEWLIARRAEFKSAAKALDNARSNLWPFGEEYDS